MEVKFTLEPRNNVYYFDEPVFRELRNCKSASTLAKADPLEYSDATKKYLSWFLTYADAVLKGKAYADATLIEQLFSTKALNKTHFKESLRCYLFVAKDYALNLLDRIDANNVLRYHHTISELDIDLEWLIVHIECIVRNKIDRVTLQSGRRPNLSPTDIFSAARELFYIEELEKVEGLYLRDLKPMVMFQIRQMLEVFGKNLLGYEEIQDAAGLPIKKFTQVAWEFIELECKKPDSRISLPFSATHIIKINSWTNNFVHTTNIHSSIIQSFALRYLSIIFRGSGKGIRVYSGVVRSKLDIADIKICEYDSLKSDFENYLNSKKSGVVVEWINVDRVGAYIISL